jgi:hypothetical protein
MVAGVDRDAIARAQRRRQALEALEFERERADALLEQLEALVTELEAPRIDAAIFARMAPEDAEVVRGTLQPGEPAGPEEEWLPIEKSWEPDPAESEAEIARLEEEIASSRRRQQAFERYIEALGD